MRVRLPEIIIHDRFGPRQLGERIPWSIDEFGIDEAWVLSRGRDVRVGIVDTGIDSAHFSEGDLVAATDACQDFTGSRNGYWDALGHGTHVAGIIGAREGNNIGVTGVAPDCRLLIAKGLGDDGTGSDQGIAQAIAWLVYSRCRVINLSLGSDGPSAALRTAVQNAAAQGVIVVCAAGNSGGRVNFPGRYPETLAISAVDSRGRIAQFSSRGPEIAVAAPGVEILSCYLNGGYGILSGTSMAAPWVTGLLALMIAHDPSATWTIESVREKLRTAARDVGDPGRDDSYGWGLVDPSKAVSREPTVPGGWSHTWGPITVNIPAAAGDDIGLNVL